MQKVRKSFRSLGVVSSERLISPALCETIAGHCERIARLRNIVFECGLRHTYSVDAKFASYKDIRSSPAFFLVKNLYEECHEFAKSVWGQSLQLSPHMLSRCYYEQHKNFGDGHGWHAEKSTLTLYLALSEFSEPIEVIPAGANTGPNPNAELAMRFTPSAGDVVAVAGRYIWTQMPPLKFFSGEGRKFLVMNFHDANDMNRQDGFDESLFNLVI